MILACVTYQHFIYHPTSASCPEIQYSQTWWDKKQGPKRHQPWPSSQLYSAYSSPFQQFGAICFRLGYLELFRAIQSYIMTFGVIWSHLESFRVIWSHLKPFGAIWSHLEPFQAISSKLEPFWAIWSHFDQFGAIWTFSYFSYFSSFFLISYFSFMSCLVCSRAFQKHRGVRHFKSPPSFGPPPAPP